MIERNIGDHTDPRLNHIGCIQASAHSHFEHSDLHFAGREIFKCYCRQHLKKTGMPRQLTILDQPFSRAFHQIVQQCELIVRDLLTVDLNTFVDSD